MYKFKVQEIEIPPYLLVRKIRVSQLFPSFPGLENSGGLNLPMSLQLHEIDAIFAITRANVFIKSIHLLMCGATRFMQLEFLLASGACAFPNLLKL